MVEPKLVELEKKEFDVINDGKGLRMRVPLMATKTYNKQGLLAKKAELEEQLVEVNSLLSQCATLKISE